MYKILIYGLQFGQPIQKSIALTKTWETMQSLMTQNAQPDGTVTAKILTAETNQF